MADVATVVASGTALDLFNGHLVLSRFDKTVALAGPLSSFSRESIASGQLSLLFLTH